MMPDNRIAGDIIFVEFLVGISGSVFGLRIFIEYVDHDSRFLLVGRITQCVGKVLVITFYGYRIAESLDRLA